MRLEKTDQLPAHLLDVEFISEVVPDILNLKSIAPPYRLFRYDKADDRYYFRYVGGQPIGYLSMTSFVSKVLPTSPFLIKWMLNLGESEADFYKNMRASYGTLTHVLNTEIERNGGGNFDEIKKMAYQSAIDQGYKHEALNWESDVINDILSFILFVKERNVETIAAEFPVCSDKYGLGGCIDRVVRMDFDSERVNAIIDYKSGKNFYDAHVIQLHGYKEIWNDLFGSVFPVTHVFNLAPVSDVIKGKAKYKLKNQTDASLSYENSPVKDWIVDQLLMAKKRGMVNPPTSHFDVRGEFKLDNFNVEDHIVTSKI